MHYSVLRNHRVVQVLLKAGLDRIVHHNLFLWEEVASVQIIHTLIQMVKHLLRNEQLFYMHTIPVEDIAPNHCGVQHMHGAIEAGID